jgi:P27 family predicted phage terminase small subunit
MTQRGRRPKPSYLKVVTGNPGKRPIGEDWVKPEPPKRPIAAPALLDRYAKAEWTRLAPGLHKLGLLTFLDRGPFVAYCQAWSIYRHAQEALDDLSRKDDSGLGGMLMRTKAGNTIQNPLIGIRNKALRDMVRYAAEFGFTPSARARVQDAAPKAAKGAASGASFFDDD